MQQCGTEPWGALWGLASFWWQDVPLVTLRGLVGLPQTVSPSLLSFLHCPARP